MAEPITDAEIEKLRELEKRATPGPWHTGGIAFPDDPVLRHTSVWGPREHPDDQSGRWIDRHITEANASLVCATRNALPALLARIAELEGERARQDEAIVTMFAQLSAAREALRQCEGVVRAHAMSLDGQPGESIAVGALLYVADSARALLADSGEAE